MRIGLLCYKMPMIMITAARSSRLVLAYSLRAPVSAEKLRGSGMSGTFVPANVSSKCDGYAYYRRTLRGTVRDHRCLEWSLTHTPHPLT